MRTAAFVVLALALLGCAHAKPKPTSTTLLKAYATLTPVAAAANVSSAKGAFAIVIESKNKQPETATYSLTVEGMKNLTMAHIHYNVTGGVLAGLIPFQRAVGTISPPLTNKKISVENTFDASLLLTDLFANLTNKAALTKLADLGRQGFLYVNVHTTAFPGGEIRGTITTKPPKKGRKL